MRRSSRRSLKAAEESCEELMVDRKSACARVYAPDGREVRAEENGGKAVDEQLVAACHLAMREEKHCIGSQLCPAQARRYYSELCSPGALAGTDVSDAVRERCRGYAYDLAGCMHSYFRQVAARDLTSSFRSAEEEQQVMPYEYTEADERLLQESE